MNKSHRQGKSSDSSLGDAGDAGPSWRVIFLLLPFLLVFRYRVALALVLLIAAKLVGVALPWMMKLIVDDLDAQGAELIVVPLALLIGYGAFRFLSVFLGELRDAIFARVTERAMRSIALKVFSHLHALDLEFHLSRKTGGLSRDIERGTSGISFLMRFLLFNIAPTILEIILISVVLFAHFSPVYTLGIILSVAAYVWFSVVVTEWRNRFIRDANEQDSKSNSRAIDSLLNYETVKFFNNEQFEAKEYDAQLALWEQSRLKNRLTLTALNSGQALIIAVSMTVMMVMAAFGVAQKTLTLGDFVMINAYMIQLFVPLNVLGFVYREIRQSLVNIERMFQLLHQQPKVHDQPHSRNLNLSDSGDVSIEFRNVDFYYSADRPILRGLSFSVEAGKKVAIVGASGAGKSTIAKLLFRFYDVQSGAILINGEDIRHYTLDSLRAIMGVVPQDTVLFNDTLRYNIAYGNTGAQEADIARVCESAHLHHFIASLPKGLDTVVGERGLKISGGEKQRVSIARVLLKNPPLLIFDEATSALDTEAELSITTALDALAQRHTTVVIAHRLSTVMNADKIIVIDAGEVVEQGTHDSLLAAAGRYHQLWFNQLKEHGSDSDFD